MKFRKKPVVIEAELFKGYNLPEIKKFCPSAYQQQANPHVIFIPTLEGVMIASIGDWIIKGVADEFYPCKPDIFEKTYSPFDESINQEGSLKDSDWKEKFREWDEGRCKFEIYRDTEALVDWFEENVIAPLLQKECKGDDLVAEQPVSSKMEHTEIGGSSENGRWVNRREREPEKTGKYKIRYALTDFDDSFEEAEETYYNQSGWNKHGYAQFVMAWWEESNTGSQTLTQIEQDKEDATTTNDDEINKLKQENEALRQRIEELEPIIPTTFCLNCGKECMSVSYSGYCSSCSRTHECVEVDDEGYRPFTKIVCYCGSLRVALEAFKKAEYDAVLKGEIALLPCCMFVDIEREYGAESDYKQKADDLHKRKIDLCDEVFVLNVGGYIGNSTRSEIDYAIANNRPIRYLEPNRITEPQKEVSQEKPNSSTDDGNQNKTSNSEATILSAPQILKKNLKGLAKDFESSYWYSDIVAAMEEYKNQEVQLLNK